MEVAAQFHAPTTFNPREIPRYPRILDWAKSTAVLDMVMKDRPVSPLQEIEPRVFSLLIQLS